MKFNVCDLGELAYGGKVPGYEVISNSMVGSSRWDVHYRLVFKFDGKFYVHPWSRGATEQQGYDSFEFEGDQIECEEVFPRAVVKTVYLSKEETEEVPNESN